MTYPPGFWSRFWAKTDQSGGLFACWPWRGAKSKKRNGTRRGHIQIRLGPGKRGKPNCRWVLAHVVALASASDGEIEKYDTDGVRLEASHKCNAKWGDCCNPAHLAWQRPEQNREDRYGVRSPEVPQPVDASPPRALAGGGPVSGLRQGAGEVQVVLGLPGDSGAGVSGVET